VRCPGCDEDALRLRDRLRVAARAQVYCPACGVAIRLGFWPRIVHLVFGDAVVIAGFVGAFVLQSPLVLGLASSSWIVAAMVVPIRPGQKYRQPVGSGE